MGVVFDGGVIFSDYFFSNFVSLLEKTMPSGVHIFYSSQIQFLS